MGAIPRVASFGSRPMTQPCFPTPPKYNPCPLLKKKGFATKASIVNSPEGAVLVFGEALFGESRLDDVIRIRTWGRIPWAYILSLIRAGFLRSKLFSWRRLLSRSERRAPRTGQKLVNPSIHMNTFHLSSCSSYVPNRGSLDKLFRLSSDELLRKLWHMEIQDAISWWGTCECGSRIGKIGDQSGLHHSFWQWPAGKGHAKIAGRSALYRLKKIPMTKRCTASRT